MITFKHIGNFKKTEKLLNYLYGQKYLNILAAYGEKGVKALSEATPKNTGKTASSWYYEITQDPGSSTISINFHNSNVNKGVNIALILQYGHGTGTGGFVSGIDYINPSIQPIFEQMADEVWKAVGSK